MRPRAAFCCSLFFVLCSLFSAPAQAIYDKEWNEGQYTLELTGALRLTGAFLHLPDALAAYSADDGLAASVARLLVNAALGQRIKLEANLYADLSRAPAAANLGGAFATAGASRTPYRTAYLRWNYWEDGAVKGQLGLDRLAVKLQYDSLQLELGRIPINYSKTMLFAPNDFFAPFSATAINKIYKPGVDALRVSFAAGQLSNLELVAVLGFDGADRPSWSHSAVLLRANTVRWEVEWAVLGGKLAGRWVLGASLQGAVGPVGLRAEGHAGFVDHDGDGSLEVDFTASALQTPRVHGRVAAGADYRWAWRNATISGELLYQSDGASYPGAYTTRARRLRPDDLPYLGQLYLGLSGGLELLPILRANALVLVNAQDGSGMAALTLMYNIADEADFAGGALLPWGAAPANGLSPQSEFGLYPVMLFMETRFYF